MGVGQVSDLFSSDIYRGVGFSSSSEDGVWKDEPSYIIHSRAYQNKKKWRGNLRNISLENMDMEIIEKKKQHIECVKSNNVYENKKDLP